LVTTQEYQTILPPAQTEFQNLGIQSVQLETAGGNQILPVAEFCEQLPTAAAFAKEYGVFRTAILLSRQLEQRQSALNNNMTWEITKKTGQLVCFLESLNYCLGNEGHYSDPLPYSVGLTLAAQLTYGLRSRFTLPSFMTATTQSLPSNVEVNIPSNNIPIDSVAFTRSSERTKYLDPSLSESKRSEILESGLATLVGANLLYYPFDPYSTVYIMRKNAVWVAENNSQDQLTIPGGHTVAAPLLAPKLALYRDQLNLGKKNIGHTLLDVSGLRETLEETGLPVSVLQTARPLTIADQVM